MNTLYFEIHVTLDPVFGPELESLKKLAKSFRFSVAKLLMQKGGPSEKDSFCTTRGDDLDECQRRTIEFILELQRQGFRVRRYKLEDTLVDSKLSDTWSLLS